MDKLIDFAVEMMSKENYNPDDNPTQNPEINPTQNPDINTSQNPDINDTQNPALHWSQNLNWKQAWWNKFKEMSLWDHMTENQQERCFNFLKRL